jgi:nucleoid DNA-binding protein
MSGIAELVKETNKISRVNNQQVVKEVLDAFIEIIRQKLNKGESIDLKGKFSLKRSITFGEGSNKCAKHEKLMTNYKKTIKGKGVVAFSKSEKFRKLVQEIRVCKDCRKKKRELLKSATLNKRINFEPSSLFWITTKKRKSK